MTIPTTTTRNATHAIPARYGRTATLEQRLLRLLARAPAWLASAVVHAVIIGILLQITALSPRKKHHEIMVSVSARQNESLLDRGDDVLMKPIPVVEPIIDLTSFEWDEDQTASSADLEEFATDAELPRLFALYGDYGARSAGGRAEAVRRGGGTKGSERAVALALEWLQRHQSNSGAWQLKSYKKNCIRGAECKQAADPLDGIDAGLTGLATLAFLGAGHTHQYGRFKESVASAMNYMLRIQGRDGCFGQKIGSHSIYNHAICALAVCEAYGMTKDVRYKAAAEKAIKYIAKVQHVDGGWGYVRGKPGGAMAYRSDVSVTGWLAMALKSAQMAGIELPKGTWKSVVKYVNGSSDAKGLAGYVRAREFVTPTNRSTIPVGLLCRQFAPGKVDAVKAAAIADALVMRLPSEKHEGFFYYAYYGSLSLYQYGGPKWNKWNEYVRDLLVKLQKQQGCQAGSWAPGSLRWASWAGRVYSTAMAALTLEVYYRYLPIHRGYVDETPEAAALHKYQKALSAYRFYIELSDAAKPAPEELSDARRRAVELLVAYRRAAASLKAGDEEAAERRGKRLAATAIRLATLHIRGGQYARCIKEVADFGKKYPRYEDQEAPRKLYACSLALLAGKLEAQGEESKATALRRGVIEEYYLRIERNPDQPLAVYMKVAEHCYDRQDWWRAARVLSSILERFSAEPLVAKNRLALTLRLATSLNKSGRPSDALKFFEALRKEVESAAVLEGMADCHVQIRDFESALRIYVDLRRKTKPGRPVWWRAQYNIANTLLLLGRVDECSRLIAVQKEFRPTLGGPKLQAKFENLMRACEKINGELGARNRL